MALSKTDSTAASVSTLLPAVGSRLIRARIAEQNTSHIIDRLTKLYGDPVQAIVRELVSNARDAVVAMPEAERQPVHIQSPNELERYFVVTDYGVGMTESEVEEYFANYGASFKSDDIHAIGSHGLGGKSPLAYTDSFEVTTTKDGVTTSFIMSRSGGETVTDIRSVKQTGSHSGTTVRVPVENVDIPRFNSFIEYYKRHSHSTPTVIDEVLYESNPSYVPLGDVVLYEDADGDITGKAYVRRAAIGGYISSASYSDVIDSRNFTYSLAGWLYAADGSSRVETEPNVVVEIVPALLNFGSSRDSIIVDEKLNILNQRVGRRLASADFVKTAILQIKDFNRTELATFLKSYENLFSISDDGESFSVGYRSELRNGISAEISMLESNLGFNPFTLNLRTTMQKGAISLALNRAQRTSGYYMRFLEMNNRRTRAVNGQLTARVADFTNRFHHDETKCGLPVSAIAREFFGDSITIILVHSVTDDNFKTLMRHRKELYSGGRANWIFAFSQLPESKFDADDLSLATKLLGEDSLIFMTADELLKAIKPDIDAIKLARKREREEKVSSVLTDYRYFRTPSVASDAELTAESFVRAAATRANEGSFLDVFRNGGNLIVGGNWHSVYVGAVNAGHELFKKPLFIYDGKLSAAEATQLENYKHRIYFASEANLKSVAARKLAEGRIFSGSVLTTVLSSLSLAELVKASAPYPYNTIDPIGAAPLLDFFDEKDSEIKLVLEALISDTRTATSLSTAEAVKEIRSRFGEKMIVALEKVYLGLGQILSRDQNAETLIYNYLLIRKQKPEPIVTPLTKVAFRTMARIIKDAKPVKDN